MTTPLAFSIGRFEARSALELQHSAAAPWSERDSTPAAREKRRAAIASDFALFDKLYFPPEVYEGQYGKPNQFHQTIAHAATLVDKRATLILGPNGHAKSATLYKVAIWHALTGGKHLVVFASETLDTPKAIIRAIASYIKENRRIQADFPDLEFVAEGMEYMHVRCKTNPRGTIFRIVSEERSARGMTASLFFRPDWICLEDFENRTSSMGQDAVAERRRKLAEYRNALSQDGCLTMTANNFDERCLANQLKNDAETGLLDAKFEVYTFPAWGNYYDTRGRFRVHQTGTVAGPLWSARYPATSEDELKSMMASLDDEDWQGSQQQKPIKPKGMFFKTEHSSLWTVLPPDCMGITWVDGNLAKKGKGDRTCMGAGLFSPTTQLYYGYGIRYKSYSDSNELLDDLRELWISIRGVGATLIGAGMDGNVSQESHWSQHVENYCRLKGVLLPPIDFKRYDVGLMAKTAQLVWSSKQFLLPAAWYSEEERSDFHNDLFAFSGRKLAGRADDGPDWLVCAIQYLHECGLVSDAGPLVVSRTHHGGSGYGKPRLGKL